MMLGEVAERFWSKVDRRGDDECWPWKAGRSKKGYGLFWVSDSGPRRGAMAQAHRVAFVLCGGDVPMRKGTPGAGGILVLHSCDNPPCCNPAHLSADVQKENMRQAFVRGRKRGLQGDSHGRTKLTDADVAVVRAIEWTGRYGERAEICRAFGIHKSTLYRVLNNERKTA